MAKNNVGSLYYEVLLDAGGHKEGARKIRAQDDELRRFMESNAKDFLSDRAQINAQAERLHAINMERNREDIAAANKNADLITDWAERKNREIDRIERAARDKRTAEEVRAREEARRKELADARRTAKDVARAERDIERRADRDRIARERAERAGSQTGIAGIFNNPNSPFRKMSAGLARVTMAVWPLVQAWKAVMRVQTAVIGAFVKMVNIADEFKVHLMKITQFTGDKAIAQKLIDQVEEYAIKTSLSVDAGLAMANQLLILGVSADSVAGKLKQFNSVALGDAEKFKRVAKAYTDVLGAGVLKATEMRQFTEADVPFRRFLTEMLEAEGRLGTSTVDEMISKRLITAQDVSKVMANIGKFNEGLDLARLETMAGQIENIVEEFQSWIRHSKFVNEVSEELVKSLKLVAGMATKAYQGLEQMSNSGSMLTKLINPFIGLAYTIEKIDTTIRGWERVMSWLHTGDMHAIERERQLQQAQQERMEAEADAKAQAAADEELAAKARARTEAENLKKYEELKKDLEKREETAQTKYDEWRHSNNLDNMSVEHQEKLNQMYEEQRQWEEDQAKKEAAEQKLKDDAKKLEDEIKRGEKRAQSKMEAALGTSLPSDAFKQNSVEEFRYLQQQRKDAEKQRRDDERWEEEKQLRATETLQVVEAIETINYTVTDPTTGI